MSIRHHKKVFLLLLLLLSSVVTPISMWSDAGVASASDSVSASVSVDADKVVMGAASLGKIAFGAASTLEVKDVMRLSGDKDSMVTFTVSIFNGETSKYAFKDLWVRLQSTAGNSFTVNLLPQEGEIDEIPPGTSQDFSFYAKVGASTQLQDLVFKLVQLDFKVAGFERVIGQLTPASDYSVVTPSGSKRAMQIGGTPFHAKINRASISRNDEYYLPSIYFEMENVGTGGKKLPELTYFIRTAGGQMYPLQAAPFAKDTDLQPLVQKEGLLSGSIPREAGAEGWQLVIVQTMSGSDGRTSFQLPVGFFEVPQAEEKDVSLGNDYNFSDKSGTYTVRLTSLQRLPWEDQDILAATITLSNQGSQALPLPDLKGYFKLDEAVTVEASLVRSDRVISLHPGKEITLQLAGKIPYTSEFQLVELILQEKDSEDQVSDLLTFYHNKELMGMTVIPANGTRKLTDIGQSAAYSVRSVQTFQGDSADLFTVQLSVENLEKRFTGLRKQVAQFQGADGTVFPATMTQLDNKVIPGGKALSYIYATIPKGYNMADVQLILGDEVEAGYVNAASFNLPTEMKEPLNSFANLDVYPYSITISHIGTQVNYITGTINLDFDYDLKRDSLVETSMKDHTLVVELTDKLYESGKEIIMSQAFALDGTDPSKSLLAGFHDATITYTNKDEIYKISDMKNYQLNVYHQFQNGQRKLLATKVLDWFVYTD